MTGTKKDNSTSTTEKLPVQPTDGMPGIEFDDYWEAQFQKTGNPLYVWRALNSLNVYGNMWNQHHGQSASTPRAIQVWCIQYLMEVATRMNDLCYLLDERIRPEDSEGYDALVGWANKPTLTASGAAHRLNHALNIDGASFTKLQTDTTRAEAFIEFENLIAG